MFYASGPIDMCVSSFLIDSGVLLLGLPGSPGGESLFFASPKKSNQKKGDPVRRPFVSLRACCGAQKKRGHAQTRCAQTSACPDPLFPALLTSSPRVWGGGFECGFGVSPHPRPLPEGEGVKPKSWNSLSFCPLSLWERVRVRASPNPNSFPPPVLAEPSSADGGGMPGQTCLSAASCLDRRRNRAAQVARRVSVGTQTAGRLSFGYFSLAKQRKVTRCRATPGKPCQITGLRKSALATRGQ